MNRIIREARPTDMADIMKVMNAAKKIMRQSGNMHQWGEGYPYIKMYNLRKQQIDFYFHPQYIKPEVHNGKLQRSRTEIGDLIMNIVGPPLGKLAIIPSDLPEIMSLASPFTVEMTAHFTVAIGQPLFFLPRMLTPKITIFGGNFGGNFVTC